MIQTMFTLQIIASILLCVLVILLWVIYPSIIGAPWVPTPNKRVRDMLEIADVGKGDLVFDLGSGDGRIITMAAKEFGAQSIGIEVDPLRIIWSRFKIRRQSLGHSVKVIRGNFFNINLKEATVVTIYQAFGVNKRIREKLESELRLGTRVVSYKFVLDGWTPIKTNEDASIYLYRHSS